MLLGIHACCTYFLGGYWRGLSWMSPHLLAEKRNRFWAHVWILHLWHALSSKLSNNMNILMRHFKFQILSQRDKTRRQDYKIRGKKQYAHYFTAVASVHKKYYSRLGMKLDEIWQTSCWKFHPLGFHNFFGFCSFCWHFFKNFFWLFWHHETQKKASWKNKDAKSD